MKQLFLILLCGAACCHAGGPACSDNVEFGSSFYKYFGQRTLYDVVRGNFPNAIGRTQRGKF